MKKYEWPDGKLMSVLCPNCALTVNVQVENVRDWDLPARPDECMNCGCEFDVSHTGKTTILRAHARRSSVEGIKLAKKTISFDPGA